jgi:ABC-type polysaccharide/polyol phosphate transport system ATPase subunit
VSFEVRQGEVLGIIGRNGAGKSTLLKILSRITDPTEGRIRIRGRVASLLEVGTGFHPELTGRENIFLNGAILGMSRAEIKAKFDEIASFAEVEKFLDTPVKHYSSGMYVRLAFAVAAHLEPEILVVDEVLAVGDAEFQRKCLGKMQQVSKEEGRTVLFVSHNMHAVRRLCSSGFYLSEGHLEKSGEIEQIIGCYEKSSHSNDRGRKQGDMLFQNEQLILRDVTAVHPRTGQRVARTGEPFEITFHLKVLQPCTLTSVAATIYDLAGTKLINADSLRKGDPIRLERSDDAEILIRVLNNPLLQGNYELGVWMRDASGRLKVYLRNVLQFETLEAPTQSIEIKPPDDGCVSCPFELEVSSG